MKRVCSKEGCVGKHKARGLCDKHYVAARMAGELPQETTYAYLDSLNNKVYGEQKAHVTSVEDRLKAKTQSGAGDNPCWNWVGGKCSSGYGQMSVNNRSELVHRLSYELYVGTIPTNYDIDHLCHNRACLNPAHLRAVTRSENLQNRSAVQKRNVSGVKGVYRQPGRDKWLVTIGHQGKNLYVGTYKTLEEAKKARQAKETELFTPKITDYVE